MQKTCFVDFRRTLRNFAYRNNSASVLLVLCAPDVCGIADTDFVP